MAKQAATTTVAPSKSVPTKMAENDVPTAATTTDDSTVAAPAQPPPQLAYWQQLLRKRPLAKWSEADWERAAYSNVGAL
jgi:hypothetical protein